MCLHQLINALRKEVTSCFETLSCITLPSFISVSEVIRNIGRSRVDSPMKENTKKAAVQ